MHTHRLFSQRAASLLILALSCTVAPAPATENGQAAANAVNAAEYQDFLNTWLFTHVGNNRGVNGVQHQPARDNIRALLESYGLTTALESFTYNGRTGWNVVATQTGTLYPEQQYLLGGHYDSANNPGADDNASGVAAMLESARILSQYPSEYTIKYISFDMEELGLIGASAYVNAHAGAQILGMISADMIAYDPGTNRGIINGRTTSNPIKQALAAALLEYSGGLTATVAGRDDSSDHAPFEAAGYQACVISESAWSSNPYYHTQNDNYERPGYLNFPFATAMTRGLVGWLVDAAHVTLLQQYPVGDLNCDGTVDFNDINPFVLALTDPAGYAAAFPNCDRLNADVNADGVVDFDDINPFVALLQGP